MAGNANFSTEENDESWPIFVIFGENELLEISDSLDDYEISLFIDENRNVHTTKKTETDLNVSMLMIFAVYRNDSHSLYSQSRTIVCHARDELTFLLFCD